MNPRLLERPRRVLACAGLALVLAGHGVKAAPEESGKLTWQPWSAEVFAKAKAENKFVILDLEAVWCHWCHVMEETTYADPKVIALLRLKYVTVRVDQDANPDLSNRYGDWGWPATIVFAADGTEIVKRRGYIPPPQMTSLLEAIIADPTPGPSIGADLDVAPSETPLLQPVQRADLFKRSNAAYDTANGGWGSVHKFIDIDSMDVALAAAEKGDDKAATQARQTFDAALNLMDREWGGLFQYSDKVDWSSPHYEKIMWYQANGLRQYAAAYSLWKEPRYRDAGRQIARYLTERLLSPDGAFYTSQNADVDSEMPGKAFYALSAADRDKLGRAPRIDTNIYARENGWVVSGLVAYADATGDRAALETAVRAARWIIEHRRNADGSFRHGEADRGGPFLGDTLAMGQAALDLYAATGDRVWLATAGEAGRAIGARFKDPAGGFLTTLSPEGSLGVFLKPAKPLEEQAQTTRFANRLHRYFGDPAFKELAEHGGRYVTSADILGRPIPRPAILLVDAELTHEPTHITIVGRKNDPTSGVLHAAARAYPAIYKRVDWWDKSEGLLPNPDVTYPDLSEPAAFACTNRICSLPVFDAKELGTTVAAMLQGPASSQ